MFNNDVPTNVRIVELDLKDLKVKAMCNFKNLTCSTQPLKSYFALFLKLKPYFTRPNTSHASSGLFSRMRLIKYLLTKQYWANNIRFLNEQYPWPSQI